MKNDVLFKSDLFKPDEAYTFRCPGCGNSHFFIASGQRAWKWNKDMVKPTVKPSIKVSFSNKAGDQCCHFFITAGQIRYCNDSTHELAGKTVDMVPDEMGDIA